MRGWGECERRKNGQGSFDPSRGGMTRAGGKGKTDRMRRDLV